MRRQNQHKHQNSLILYRERIGYTQLQVAALLGATSTASLSRFERGHQLPSLPTALKLAIIYRVPVDYLYSELYGLLRERIRAKEQAWQQDALRTSPHQT